MSLYPPNMVLDSKTNSLLCRKISLSKSIRVNQDFHLSVNPKIHLQKVSSTHLPGQWSVVLMVHIVRVSQSTILLNSL